MKAHDIYFFNYGSISICAEFSSDNLCEGINFCHEHKSVKTQKHSPAAQVLDEYFKLYFSGENPSLNIIFKYKEQELLAQGIPSLPLITLNMSTYSEKELKVYLELLKIQYGETISYGDLAANCGFHGAARFIGNTMAKNKFPIIIPCHRVIKSNGSLGNYTGGVDIKKSLLSFESDY
jgi:O-6-methylguanine DNA methyltransferase